MELVEEETIKLKPKLCKIGEVMVETIIHKRGHLDFRAILYIKTLAQ